MNSKLRIQLEKKELINTSDRVNIELFYYLKKLTRPAHERVESMPPCFIFKESRTQSSGKDLWLDNDRLSGPPWKLEFSRKKNFRRLDEN